MKLAPPKYMGSIVHPITIHQKLLIIKTLIIEIHGTWHLALDILQ
jgi:hypothetical protein